MNRYSLNTKLKKILFSKIQQRNKKLKYMKYFRFNNDIKLLNK